MSPVIVVYDQSYGARDFQPSPCRENIYLLLGQQHRLFSYILPSMGR